MRSWLFVVLGVVLVVLGLVWVLQGLDVVTGSFMSGQKLWFAIGLLLALGGVASLYSGWRRLATARK
jgi:hypothetical protein